MILAIPLFLLFCVYGVVNAYLPVLLSSLGYSIAHIGILQGIFEASGMLIPVFVSSRVERNGNYGWVVIILAAVMIVVLPPLALVITFPVTAIALAFLAVGYKGTVPLVDAMVSHSLGDKTVNYGKIRVMGSIGFVCMTLLLQFTPLVNPSSPPSIARMFALPSFLFILSMLFIPGLLVKRPPSADASSDKGLSRLGIRSYLEQFPRSFWIGVFLIFLGFFGMTPSQRFLSLYVRDYLGLESYAGLWALSAAAEIPFMFLSGWFIGKWGTRRILLFALLSITARNLVYAIFPTFSGAIAGQLFHSVCFGLFHPAAVVFISERVPKRLLAVGLTIYTSVAVSMSSVIGNVAGGFIIDRWGYRVLFVFFSVFPLLGVLFFMLMRTRKQGTH